METFSALLAICAGNSPVDGEFTAQRPVTRSFDVFFDLHLNKRLKNSREADDLRRHGARYDVILMCSVISEASNFNIRWQSDAHTIIIDLWQKHHSQQRNNIFA